MTRSDTAPVARPRCPTLKALTVLLIGLVALEYGLWLPQYLTWPWWADHDVFASLAQGWDSGLKPYRDLLGNNFPGAIYLFWIAGKLCGWGNTAAYNGLDALLNSVFGIAVLAWSRRRLGTWLPGAVTLFALGSYYFALDFTQVAQRDWHAAMFVSSAMMAIEALPGRSGRWLSVLLVAVAFTIRPQAVLFIPVLLWSLRGTENPLTAREGLPVSGLDLRLMASWLILLSILTAVFFLPLIIQGLMGDFVRGLRAVLPGSGYGQGKLAQFEMLARSLFVGRVWGLPLAIALVSPSATASTRSSTIGWLLMLGGSIAYMATMPVLRTYSYHPFWMLWAFVLGNLVAMLVEVADRPWRDRVLAITLFCIIMDMESIPRICSPKRFVSAVKSLATGQPPEQAPWGYRLAFSDSVVLFPWSEYQATLRYLRTELGPETRVANALKGVALNGPAGRLSAFPAESATWLFVVQPRDEEKFIMALRATPDSVVVWAPEATGVTSVPDQFPRLAQTIRLLYEPSARFGAIEVWRRRPTTGHEAARHVD